MKKLLNGYEMVTTGESGFGLALGIILVALAILAVALSHEDWEYHYTDMDGNTGVSSHCETPSMGVMQCDLPGRGKVQVKQYQGRKVKNGN